MLQKMSAFQGEESANGMPAVERSRDSETGVTQSVVRIFFSGLSNVNRFKF